MFFTFFAFTFFLFCFELVHNQVTAFTVHVEDFYVKVFFVFADFFVLATFFQAPRRRRQVRVETWWGRAKHGMTSRTFLRRCSGRSLRLAGGRPSCRR